MSDVPPIQVDVPNYYEQDEILELYAFVARGMLQSRESLDSLEDHGKEIKLDPIACALVGSVDAGRYLHSAPQFLRHALSILCRVLPDGAADPVFSAVVSPAEQEEAKHRRGVPPVKPLSKYKTRIFSQLMQESAFFAHVTPSVLGQWRQQGYRQAMASIFPVPKGDDLLRVITDARWANIRISKSSFPLEFIALDIIRNAWARLCARQQTFYALTCDLRHWFHALELPARYQHLFCIEVNDDKGIASTFCPKALPMGWKLAPVAAQAATMAILLGDDRNRHGDARHVPSNYGIDEAALGAMVGPDWEKVPPYIPLVGGGMLVVFLDNILVLTDKKAIAERWQRRINTVFRKEDGSLMLKPLKDAELAGSLTPDDKHVLFQRFDQAHPGTEMVFLGVCWSRAGARIELTQKQQDEQLPFIPAELLGRADIAAVGVRGSVYSALGKILWFIRATGGHLCESKHEDVLRLFSKFAPTPRQSWQSAVDISAADLAIIERLWRDRCANGRVRFPPLADVERALLMSSDAAGAKGGQRGTEIIGVVLYDRRPEGPNLHEESTSIAVAKSIPRGNLEASIRAILDDAERDDETARTTLLIHLCELAGILQLVLLARAATELQAMLLIIVGTDSMTARSWCLKKYARNAYANRLLRLLFTQLGQAQMALCYIGHREIVADPFSRVMPGEEDQIRETAEVRERSRVSLRKLTDAYVVATSAVERGVGQVSGAQQGRSQGEKQSGSRRDRPVG